MAQSLTVIPTPRSPRPAPRRLRPERLRPNPLSVITISSVLRGRAGSVGKGYRDTASAAALRPPSGGINK